MAATNEKVFASGKTHNTSGRDGTGHSADGFLDLKMAQPHPVAENLFGAAWSGCFMAAMQAAAAQQKIKLPADPSIDAEIDLMHAGGTNYFLRARLTVSVPGLDRATAESIVHAAHEICPYSKATRGNIEVNLSVK